MSEEKCGGKCSCCQGCGERVILSNNPEINFVSTLTFTERNLSACKALVLVTECCKESEGGECYAGITFFKDNSATDESEPEKYLISKSELKQQNFRFEPIPDADKAEIKIFCKNGATLHIEHINVIREGV